MTRDSQGDSNELQERVAVITGGAGGLGQEIAVTLAKSGARIVSLDLSNSDETIAKIAALRGEAIGLIADLTDEKQVASAFQEIMRRYGRIDILVNSAGLYQVARRPFWEIPLAEWQRIITTNVDSTFLCAQYASKSMRAHKQGRIINISSNTITFGMANSLHYIAAKAAVVSMTRGMARELGDFKITVNAVAPGIVSTPSAKENIDQDIFDFAVQTQSIKQQIEACDIANAVSYLCSPGARLVTGQTLLVNGGATFSGI